MLSLFFWLHLAPLARPLLCRSTTRGLSFWASKSLCCYPFQVQVWIRLSGQPWAVLWQISFETLLSDRSFCEAREAVTVPRATGLWLCPLASANTKNHDLTWSWEPDCWQAEQCSMFALFSGGQQACSFDPRLRTRRCEPWRNDVRQWFMAHTFFLIYVIFLNLMMLTMIVLVKNVLSEVLLSCNTFPDNLNDDENEIMEYSTTGLWPEFHEAWAWCQLLLLQLWSGL